MPHLKRKKGETPLPHINRQGLEFLEFLQA
jgi:hypothetical protein